MILPTPGEGEHQLGNYRLLSRLGAGGFATVYLAEDVWIGKRVALKVPHDQDAELVDKLAESRILAGLEHPGIVQVYTAGVADLSWRPDAAAEFRCQTRRIFHVVMEHVDGEALSLVLDRRGRVPTLEALGLVRQVADALDHAHARRVVHRDLKPANLLLRRDGWIKVADFGTSRLLVDITHAPTRIGSPPYMAPEQFRGRATFASDIYALGVILYELLFGRVPIFDVDPAEIERRAAAGDFERPRAIDPGLPAKVEQVVVRALASHPRDRFSTARRFEQAVAETLEELGAAAGTPLGRSQATGPEPVRAVRGAGGGGGPRRSRPEGRTEGLELVPVTCWNCGRLLSRRAAVCPHCDEPQDRGWVVG